MKMKAEKKTTQGPEPYFLGWQMPSTRMLAMLAATMGKGPEDALCLWAEAQKIVRDIQSLSEEDRGKVLASCGRMYNYGFIEGNISYEKARDSGPCAKTYTMEEAMKELNIVTKDTFFNLFEYFIENATGYGWHDWEIPHLKDTLKELEYPQSTGIISGDVGLISDHLFDCLKEAKADKRAEIARANKVKAGKKRKARKPVK